ncbi:hypothetical protein SBADM41S_09687 [Streptomyces badius]
MRDDRIAVIGAALRFPGADTPEAYWRDIRAGRSHVRRFTRAEFAAAGVPAAEYERPGFGGASAPLADVDGFDAGFFGMSGREAELTDPQQRLFLECCFHALEDGGYAGGETRYAGGDAGRVRIGVYGSSGYRLYSLHSYLAHHLAAEAGSNDWMTAKQVQVGNYTDFTATRAAFRLGLTGPALTVSTACSSALVSVHLACQALRAGDADLMLVGSAALHLRSPIPTLHGGPHGTEQAVLERVLELTARHLGHRPGRGLRRPHVRRARRGLAPAHRDGTAVGGRVRHGDQHAGGPGGRRAHPG